MTQAFEQLKSDVAALTSAADSARALLAGLKAQLDEARNASDPASALGELSAAIEAQTSALAAAVVANTPVDPAPVPPPAQPPAPAPVPEAPPSPPADGGTPSA